MSLPTWGHSDCRYPSSSHTTLLRVPNMPHPVGPVYTFPQGAWDRSALVLNLHPQLLIPGKQIYNCQSLCKSPLLLEAFLLLTPAGIVTLCLLCILSHFVHYEISHSLGIKKKNKHSLWVKSGLPLIFVGLQTKCVFYIVNGEQKSKGEHFMTYENYMRFKFQSMSKFDWNKATLLYLVNECPWLLFMLQ